MTMEAEENKANAKYYIYNTATHTWCPESENSRYCVVCGRLLLSWQWITNGVKFGAKIIVRVSPLSKYVDNFAF